MARKPVTPPRIIPNWQMDRPWTDPASEEELDMLAQTALLSGAPDTNQGVTTVLGRFAGQYVENLNRSRG